MFDKTTEAKILNENKGIAFRIASVSPSMSRKNLEKEFSFHVKYKANICKFEEQSKTVVKKVKLESLSPLNSRKNIMADSPLPNIKNPYMSIIKEIMFLCCDDHFKMRILLLYANTINSKVYLN